MKFILPIFFLVFLSSCASLNNSNNRKPTGTETFNVGDPVFLRTTLSGYPYNTRDWPGEMYRARVASVDEDGALRFEIADRPDLEEFFNNNDKRNILFNVIHAESIPLTEVDVLEKCNTKFTKGTSLAVLDLNSTSTAKVDLVFSEGYAKINCGDKCSNTKSYVPICAAGPLNVMSAKEFWGPNYHE